MANKTPPGRRCRRCREWLSYSAFPLARHVCRLCASTTAPALYPELDRWCGWCGATFVSRSRRSLYCGKLCGAAAANDARTARRRARKAARP